MPNPLRDRNDKVNVLLQEELSSLPHASFLNVGRGFVLSNGTISHQDMYDYLHLTPRGYQTVCKPLHDKLRSMLDEPSDNWAASEAITKSVCREHHTKYIYMFIDRWNPFLRAEVGYGPLDNGTINLVHANI